MDVQILNDKLDLIQWLSMIEDEVLIEKLVEFRKKESSDWWNEVSEEVKLSVKKGIKQAENKELKPHSDARKIYEKWL